MEEQAVEKVVEKLGESVIWSPGQKVSLLQFENWKGEYVRIESGEEIVDEITKITKSLVTYFYFGFVNLRAVGV
jgi:hypothetical protein